jgi:two-component system sensor histidine kinase ChvG
MRITLRVKLALISLLLLFLPLLGMRLNSSLKDSLIASQEDALNLTALAVSAALNNKADLFSRERFHSLQQDRDLYLFQLSTPIQLNGKIDDWLPEFNEAGTFGNEHLLTESPEHTPENLSFRHLAGMRGQYLYALFDIQDDKVTYRDKGTLRLDRSDHLQITIEDDNGQRKYIVSGYDAGWVLGFLIPDNPSLFPKIEKRIHGRWEQTDKGYMLEIRMHSEVLGSKLAFAVADVDDPETGQISALIGTAKLQEDEEPGWLLTTSTAIEEILELLDRPHARIRVVDQNQRIRAEVGGLRESGDQLPASGQAIDEVTTFVHGILQPLYRLFTSPFTTDIEESLSQPTEINLKGIKMGFAGESSIERYPMQDGLVDVMAAFTPVFDKDEVIAVVLVEQTTNSILSLSNQLIEEIISLSVVAFLVGGGALFIFAYVVSARIRKLRNQAGASITEGGQVINAVNVSDSKDEIGDLGRTLNSMLIQLQEQIDYREKMADNLEHEMRTPLAGVAASLKNIEEELDDQPPQLLEYLDGAKHNTQRLHELLTSIREATTLKDSLTHESMEIFNFDEALTRWLDAVWRKAFPDVDFIFNSTGQAINIKGDPVRLHQALDKLVENAVSYHTPGTQIELNLIKHETSISLQVINQGETIDRAMQQQIFNYMFSSRVSKESHPHLGLGLYITKTIFKHHGGNITVDNLEDGHEGVVFTAQLPL